MLKHSLRWTLAALCLGAASTGIAAQLMVVSFGGATRDAQRDAFYKPFKATTGTVVINGSYNGDFDKLRRMQAAQHVSWDVVEVEAPELVRGCETGLFQPLDAQELGDTQAFIPGALRPCGVGTFVWSMVLAYDSQRLSQAPQGWADFWDVQRFPGNRGLRKGAKYNLEFALLASGVPAEQVYARLATRQGVDMAFDKLDQLRPYIRWWQAGEEPIRGLNDGSLLMSASYSGRIGAAQDQGAALQLVWPGSIYDFDYWAIPSGSFNSREALQFIRFASQRETQQVFAERIPYGPVNSGALAGLAPERVARLPTAPANMAQALPMGVEFWIEHGDELEQRFERWLARP
jgi:putative spermidine/putrescine transport system substrate-binding protein